MVEVQHLVRLREDFHLLLLRCDFELLVALDHSVIALLVRR